MAYLLTQMIFALGLAAVFGGAVGWLLHRSRANADKAALRQIIHQQQGQMEQARSEVAMLADDFNDLKEQSRLEIAALQQENRRIPPLETNLEKSQLMVRQMIQKHEVQLAEVTRERDQLSARIESGRDHERMTEKLTLELAEERRQHRLLQARIRNGAETGSAGVIAGAALAEECDDTAAPRISGEETSDGNGESLFDKVVEIDSDLQADLSDEIDSGNAAADDIVTTGKIPPAEPRSANAIGPKSKKSTNARSTGTKSKKSTNARSTGTKSKKSTNARSTGTKSKKSTNARSTGTKSKKSTNASSTGTVSAGDAAVEPATAASLDELADTRLTAANDTSVLTVDAALVDEDRARTEAIASEVRSSHAAEFEQTDTRSDENDSDSDSETWGSEILAVEDAMLLDPADVLMREQDEEADHLDEYPELERNRELELGDFDAFHANEASRSVFDNSGFSEPVDEHGLRESIAEGIDRQQEAEKALIRKEAHALRREAEALLADNDSLLAGNETAASADKASAVPTDEASTISTDETSAVSGNESIPEEDESMTEEDDSPARPRYDTDWLFEPVNQRDDLTRIFGIGPVTEMALNKLGITSYSQLADLKTHDIETIAGALRIVPSKIKRQNWVGNARRELESVLENL